MRIIVGKPEAGCKSSRRRSATWEMSARAPGRRSRAPRPLRPKTRATPERCCRRSASRGRCCRCTRTMRRSACPKSSRGSPPERPSRSSAMPARRCCPTRAMSWCEPQPTPGSMSRPFRAPPPSRPRSPLQACPSAASASRAFCRRASASGGRISRASPQEPRTLVFFEAPHRIAATLADLAAELGGERRAVVARELTKAHETLYRGTLAELAQRAASGGQLPPGRDHARRGGRGARDRGRRHRPPAPQPSICSRKSCPPAAPPPSPPS